MKKFRALDINTNEFVYGDLIVNKPSGAYRIVSDFALVCDSIEYKGTELVGCSGSFHNVCPKTVGQFTGLKDKNGVEIFEGDKFKFKYFKELHNYIELIGSFDWCDDELRYEIDIHDNDTYVCLSYVSNGVMCDFEVVGNIHLK